VFNATFSNISAISWQPVLVVEEAGVNNMSNYTVKIYLHIRSQLFQKHI
jgi:hypothetical protein